MAKNPEEVKLYKDLLKEELDREHRKRDDWMKVEQKMINLLEQHPEIEINRSVTDNWILDSETLTFKPNPEKYSTPRYDLLKEMMRKAHKIK